MWYRKKKSDNLTILSKLSNFVQIVQFCPNCPIMSKFSTMSNSSKLLASFLRNFQSCLSWQLRSFSVLFLTKILSFRDAGWWDAVPDGNPLRWIRNRNVIRNASTPRKISLSHIESRRGNVRLNGGMSNAKTGSGDITGRLYTAKIFRNVLRCVTHFSLLKMFLINLGHFDLSWSLWYF